MKLLEAVEKEELRVVHEATVSKMFAAAECEASKASRLRSMVGVSRQDLSTHSRAAKDGSTLHVSRLIKWPYRAGGN